MTDSRQLLTQYVTESSETAFRELVGRYIDLVFSTALRLVGGDAHCAQDVVQLVFLDLARQAPKLTQDTMLGGWLHRDTCFVASKLIRGQRRRQLREQQAAEMNALDEVSAPFEHVAPVLDDAINELGDQDRKAILLRFYEKRDLRSVGEALGTSENAAQKRVTRALNELHILLTKRGVTLSVSAMTAVLAGGVVTSAPAELAASIAAGALAGSAAASSLALKIVTMTKLKIGALSALILGGFGTGLVVQYQTSAHLREENQTLRAQLQDLRSLKQKVGEPKAQTEDPEKVRRDEADLVRLRGEVAALRRAAHSTAALSEPIPQPEKMPSEHQLHASIQNRVPNGQTLLTGGWATGSGKRVFVLATPRIWAVQSPSPQGGSASDQVSIQTRVLEVPETALAQVGLDAFRADGSESSVNQILAADQAEALLKSLASIGEAVVIAQSRIITSDGRQAQIQAVADRPEPGNPGPTFNPTIDLIPVISSDKTGVDLTLQAGLTKPDREPH